MMQKEGGWRTPNSLSLLLLSLSGCLPHSSSPVSLELPELPTLLSSPHSSSQGWGPTKLSSPSPPIRICLIVSPGHWWVALSLFLDLPSCFSLGVEWGWHTCFQFPFTDLTPASAVAAAGLSCQWTWNPLSRPLCAARWLRQPSSSVKCRAGAGIFTPREGKECDMEAFVWRMMIFFFEWENVWVWNRINDFTRDVHLDISNRNQCPKFSV